MFAKTAIPAMWKPTFRLSETGLILLGRLCLVLMLFVQPLPHKRCKAGLTNCINASTLFRAELSKAVSCRRTIGVMPSGIFRKKDAVLILLACENQAKIHYAMSVRNMLYDSLSYVGQIQRMWTKNVEKMSAAEFLSKFRKGDRLIPVLTLVFYYDVDQWDGSKDLYGILQWSEDEKKNAVLREYIPNYRINLIDAGNLERFKSDLQEVLGMIQCRGDKENLLKYINDRKEYFQNVDEETYYVIREFLHSERMLKENIEKSQGKETVDLCKALEDLYNEGIVKGVVETLYDCGIKKDDAIQRVMQKFEISKEQAEKDVEIYWR